MATQALDEIVLFVGRFDLCVVNPITLEIMVKWLAGRVVAIRAGKGVGLHRGRLGFSWPRTANTRTGSWYTDTIVICVYIPEASVTQSVSQSDRIHIERGACSMREPPFLLLSAFHSRKSILQVSNYNTRI